jgi:hypothetical protein
MSNGNLILSALVVVVLALAFLPMRIVAYYCTVVFIAGILTNYSIAPVLVIATGLVVHALAYFLVKVFRRFAVSV